MYCVSYFTSHHITSRRPGGFLVRVSENRFGYTLSYRVEDRCRHYIVEQDSRGHYALVGVPKVGVMISSNGRVSSVNLLIVRRFTSNHSSFLDLQQFERAYQLVPTQSHQRGR